MTKNAALRNPLSYPTGRPDLAPYAANWREGRGRLLDEPSSPTRSDFQRDRDRLIHSDAFRRLKHKTQVFVHHDGDHFRTRLSHTIEVSQIARALARALGVDEDLTEALALVHDFGHTPFGHGGETVLDDKLQKASGGILRFEHNAHSLRIVTHLERRYARFDGLNLTWEVLEGLVKHNGPLRNRPDSFGNTPHSFQNTPLPLAIEQYDARHPLDLWSWPSVEAQCAAIADDIAYDNHDLEDGLRAGLFALDDLTTVPLTGDILAEVRLLYPTLDDHRTIHEVIRRQITVMVEDVIGESSTRLASVNPGSADAVRNLNHGVVAFSASLAAREEELKKWLFANVYRSETVKKPLRAAQSILADLFDALAEGRVELPDGAEWSVEGLSEAGRLQKITDYLAGMTDRYAISQHKRLFDHTPRLR